MTQPLLPHERPLVSTVESGPGRRGYLGQDIKMAHWLWRMASGFIDYFLLGWIPANVLTAMGMYPGDAILIALGIVCINSGVIQGNTGQSLGKRLLGMKLMRSYVSPDIKIYPLFPGILVGMLRVFLQVINASILCIGYFWPLVNMKYQTWTDLVCGTYVTRDRSVFLMSMAKPSKKLQKAL